MNSVTAVLLALALIVVILLIVWLVLRSRPSVPPRQSPTEGPGADANEPGVSVMDPMPAHHGVDALSGGIATTDDEGDELVSQPVADVDAAAAEEFVDPGLSELGADASDDEDSEENADGVLSGTPPRTPTEAFGSAGTSGDVTADEAASRETSLLDDPDVDSTPLFRTIREELLGTVALEESDQESEAADPGAQTIDEALADDVVAEQPDMHPASSDERREWDEQAPAEPPEAREGAPDLHAEAASVEGQENVWSEIVTEGVVETGAVGTGSVGPAAEEEELLETNEQAEEEVVETGSATVSGEHPPMRRISELHEVVDGGFGIGSAATIADGAQPLGHPIKAIVNTKTYQDLHSPWYDETEPDVWFLDAGFAERAGFHRAE